MAASLDDLFHESNFHIFPSLTSIYGATTIACSGGKHKLLVAVLKGRILSFEYRKTGNSLAKTDKEVSFTYIPADANVVSIDCFLCEARGLIIAVAFFKEANGRLTNYLNIYCDYTYDASQESELHSLENIIENCRSFELGFMPLQLTHCKSKSREDNSGEKRTVFILLGDDQRIHVYSQHGNGGEFTEQNLNHYFPELSSLPGVPFYLDIKVTSDGQRRISAVGHQTGDISLFVTDLSTDEWLTSNYHTQHDSPITCIKLFTKNAHVPMPACMQGRYKTHKKLEKTNEKYHLLVTSAREDAMVYFDCTRHGFEVPILLENSSDHDCVTSCTVADVDRDGVNDIVISTYGQEVLVYKFIEPEEVDNCQADEMRDPVVLQLTWTRSFAYPVMNILLLDLTGDGLDEMAVITTKGLHVFQCNAESALREFYNKLLKLRSLEIKS